MLIIMKKNQEANNTGEIIVEIYMETGAEASEDNRATESRLVLITFGRTKDAYETRPSRDTTFRLKNFGKRNGTLRNPRNRPRSRIDTRPDARTTR